MIKIIYVVCINLKSNFLFCILNFYVYDCCSLNHYEGIIFQWQHSTCQSIKLLIYIYIERKIIPYTGCHLRLGSILSKWMKNVFFI